MAFFKQLGNTAKALEILTEPGFIRGNVNPCLYVRKSKKV